MHQRFRNELIRRQLPFVEIAGDMPERLRKAVAAVEALLRT
jgi:nicotinamide riboside kinase